MLQVMNQIVPHSSNAKQLAILSKAIIILKDSFVAILVKNKPRGYEICFVLESLNKC